MIDFFQFKLLFIVLWPRRIQDEAAKNAGLVGIHFKNADTLKHDFFSFRDRAAAW